MQDKALPELKLKILIIGDSAVGKTSMLLKYVENFFPEAHMSTIGVEYKTKTITTDKYKITLQIWDTAGQERFKSITRTFYSNANGIIFVYDITSKESFEGVKNWIKDSSPYGNFESVLCGNKVDLEAKRQVKYDTLKEFGLKKKMEIFETSALNGTNLDKVFKKIVDLIIKGRTHEELIKDFGVKSTSNNINLTKKSSTSNQKDSKTCCK